MLAAPDLIAGKPRLTLRQLVHRCRGVPFFTGRVHVYCRTAERTLCGRSLKTSAWATQQGWPGGGEYPAHPIANCAKCLDNLAVWQARLAGAELIIDQKASIHIRTRRLTLSQGDKP